MASSGTRKVSASVPPPVGDGSGFAGMIGQSAPMLEIFARIQAMTRSSAPVFIEGETGTGKELAAAAIHACSGRGGAFIAVNC